MAEFPRCAICRVVVEPGQNVVFRSDGRVAHVECPEVLCPVCTHEIRPGEPIRRNGEEMLHGNCWVKRYRAMAGGAGDSPWTVVFERGHARAAASQRRFAELILAAREVVAEARAIRRLAAYVRRSTRTLRAARTTADLPA